MSLTIDKKSANVLFCTKQFSKGDKEFELLVVSDVHFDSKHCDRELLKQHFDEAKKRGAMICCFGDWFDVMGCHKDPRSKPADIREEYIRPDKSYLDIIIEDSAQFLAPYKENLLLFSYGNHESSILKHRDTDPLDRLVFFMTQFHKAPYMQKGGYSGFIKLMLVEHGARTAKTIYYHHGKGGNAKRSKGILYSQLDAMMVPDADIILSGHDHNKIVDPSNVRMRLLESGRIAKDCTYWIKTGSYKDGIGDGLGGFEVERGFMPTKMGGWFLSFSPNRRNTEEGRVFDIDFSFFEAK